MSRGIHETPMDFEYYNGTGPIDGRSPFAQVSQNQQRFPPSMSSTKKRMYGEADVEMGDAPVELTGGTADSYRGFDSPSKPRSNHPSPSKPLPPTPAAYNAMFSTPRKMHNDFEDSSAGETPKSPEQNMDSDATPDYNANRTDQRRPLGPLGGPVTLPTTAGAERSSPIKDKPSALRRDSWMVRVKNKLYSPGRGEVPRADHSHAMDRRIEKRRKREVDRKVSRKRRHSVSSSEGDNEDSTLPISPRKSSRQHNHPQPSEDQPASKEPFWLRKVFKFIGDHPTVPHILSFYAQFAFNVLLLSGVVYLFYSFWSAIQGDVDKKAHEAMADIMAEMAACANDFTVNKCERATRMPALETKCEFWGRCMSRDPTRVARARVSAHTFAEIFNSFVEPISYKAMLFTSALIFGSFFFGNLAFNIFRRPDSPPNYAPPPPPQGSYFQQPPPPTPHRSFSGPGDGFYAGTPWHQPPVGLEPAPSGAWGQIEGKGSPVRRLQW
ncbi:hypothetical protein D0868_08475 [Hortaea werneckii]|nr:hypothetical protein D0868_08475 [Hortaea werneckii]